MWTSHVPESHRMSGVQSLKVDELLGSDTSDVERWKRLARLLAVFPNLRPLEVTGFSFDMLASKDEDLLANLLTPSSIAQHYPVLSAILQYLRHRSAFRESVVPSLDHELRATRTRAQDDFELQRWTISAAEHDMFLEVF
ncbi:hypothetical protein JCM10296v2_005817 [Rhodotorula toruloides]